MHIKKKIFKSYFLIILLIVFVINCGERDQNANLNHIVIAVNQFVHHPNLEKTYNGFKEVLAVWATNNNKSIEYNFQVANGDISLTTQIARQHVAEKPDLILALATPSAQACAKATQEIPIVFGAITDPVAAGLVSSNKQPGGNITGTSDQWPYNKQFELIRVLFPDAKKIGIVLNPGESNTVASMKLIDAALLDNDFQKVESSVTNTSEILAAAQSLVGRCDVFFAPADNTVLSGLDAFIRIAQQNSIPLFVGDEGSVEKGGIATYGIDYYELGIKTGEIAIKIFEGISPADIPVSIGASGRLLVNTESAKKYKIVFPENLLNKAIIVK